MTYLRNALALSTLIFVVWVGIQFAEAMMGLK